MAVGADRNLGQGPVPADTADEPAQMAAHLLARRRLARAQQHRHRSADRGVIDMDRQEPALIPRVGPKGRLHGR
jgi:hypothetical protein